MTDTVTTPITDKPSWFGGDPEMWWVSLIPAGLLGGWASLAAALVVGGWAVGDVVAPTAGVTAETVWMALADGYRLDEAWLLASPAAAVAPAAYLWAVFVATLATMIAASAVAVEWWKAGRPVTLAAPGRDRRPSRRFRSRRWPLRPPWTPQRPGPGVLLGREHGRLTVAGDGLPVLVVGPTGSGKTRHLIGPNVAHWPGPAVVTSVKTDLADYTAAHRARLGNCYGFDPKGALWPWMRTAGITPVVWDPIRLLAADPTREHADLLAQFLTSHSSAHAAGSQGIWATLAREVLASVLLIAVDLDKPLSTALRWMIDVEAVVCDDDFPIQTLSDDGRRAARDLRLMAQNDPRIWGSIEVTIREVTGSLTATAEKLSHHDDAELLPVDLTVNPDRQDTLYLVADHMTQTTYRPVFAAVVRHLFHITESSHPGPDRLPDRPLFALDELANLARIEDLPEVLSTIRARAQVIVGIQEVSQLVSGWGRDKATTVVGNLPTKVILPGSSDAAALRRWSDLSGDDDYALDTWRTIRTGRARVLAGNRKPFEIQLSDPKRWMPKIDKPAGPPPEPAPQGPPPPKPATEPAPASEPHQPQPAPASEPHQPQPLPASEPAKPAPGPVEPEPETKPQPVEPEPETMPEPAAGGGGEQRRRRPLRRRVWDVGTAAVRRGMAAMFGPLRDDEPAARSAGLAGIADQLGMGDLVESSLRARNGNPVVVGEDADDVRALLHMHAQPQPAPASEPAQPQPDSPPAPEPARQRVLVGVTTAGGAAGRDTAHGALFGPAVEQLRVIENDDGPYGLHAAGFVVDLSARPDDETPDRSLREVT